MITQTHKTKLKNLNYILESIILQPYIYYVLLYFIKRRELKIKEMSGLFDMQCYNIVDGNLHRLMF